MQSKREVRETEKGRQTGRSQRGNAVSTLAKGEDAKKLKRRPRKFPEKPSEKETMRKYLKETNTKIGEKDEEMRLQGGKTEKEAGKNEKERIAAADKEDTDLVHRSEENKEARELKEQQERELGGGDEKQR